MHSSVFELSRIPIPVSERAIAGNLPDWFFEQVCDYAENPNQAQREEAIGQLCNQLGNLCTRNGDMLTISPQIRERYFRKSYGGFKVAAEKLTQTEYEAFSGIRDMSAFLSTLNILNDSYEDRQGIYIYLTQSGELVTLDGWLRTADFSSPFYIGGTISYHC